MEQDRGSKQSWRIDKNIPVMLIIFLIAQTVALAGWAAKLDSSVADHERRIIIGEAYDRDYSRSTLEICQRLARVEEKVGGMMTVLDQINAKMNMSLPTR